MKYIQVYVYNLFTWLIDFSLSEYSFKIQNSQILKDMETKAKN